MTNLKERQEMFLQRNKLKWMRCITVMKKDSKIMDLESYCTSKQETHRMFFGELSTGHRLGECLRRTGWKFVSTVGTITLYLEGCDFRRVARIMTKIYGKLFHNQTIIQWVKKAGEQALQERKTQTPMEIVEMDELYTYVIKKGLRTQIWTAVDRNKNRICEFFVGLGNRRSLHQVLDKIGVNNLKIVCTDSNFAYESELGMNKNVKHVVSKSETCLVESYNLVLMYYLARLQGKTKSHSKSLHRLELSVALFVEGRNVLCLVA